LQAGHEISMRRDRMGVPGRVPACRR
jgi:hypothetical protein